MASAVSSPKVDFCSFRYTLDQNTLLKTSQMECNRRNRRHSKQSSLITIDNYGSVTERVFLNWNLLEMKKFSGHAQNRIMLALNNLNNFDISYDVKVTDKVQCDGQQIQWNVHRKRIRKEGPKWCHFPNQNQVTGLENHIPVTHISSPHSKEAGCCQDSKPAHELYGQGLSIFGEPLNTCYPLSTCQSDIKL